MLMHAQQFVYKKQCCIYFHFTVYQKKLKTVHVCSRCVSASTNDNKVTNDFLFYMYNKSMRAGKQRSVNRKKGYKLYINASDRNISKHQQPNPHIWDSRCYNESNSSRGEENIHIEGKALGK